MSRNPESVYYGDYLHLNKMLDCQKPVSPNFGEEHHDETLFIIVHQVYELWFKQILKELDSAHEVFSQDRVPEKDLTLVVSRFERIEKIQQLLLDQFNVLETMTPMDFLEFRDLLVPASGFQSRQFREIEIQFGLGTSNRHKVDREYFLGRLNEQDREKLEKFEKNDTLFDLIEGWLERLPFTENSEWNFWENYQEAVDKMLSMDEKIITDNKASLSERSLNIQLENLRLTRETFDSLLSEEKFDELNKDNQRRLSRKATLNSLFILLYRDEPILYAPFRLLTSLMNIDENFTTWRYRHSLLAQRMLGSKIGTGGSSGHVYLKRAAENNRIFVELFELSSFLIPRSQLPKLPREIRQMLDFRYR